ncbi:MAG: tetratricopeptide repeat protein [Vicinamibacterales bacterium]
MDLGTLVATLAPDVAPWPEPVAGRLIVVTGPPAARSSVAHRMLRRLHADRPDADALSTAPIDWPFVHPGPVPAGAAGIVWAPELHEAFVNRQANATRLVTTQPLYVLQAWLDAVRGNPHLRLIATADREILATDAEEAVAARGAWRHVTWVEATGADGPAERPVGGPLAAAFRSADPADRLAAAGRALDRERSASHLLAMASTCMEVNDLENAGDLLAEAVDVAPDWPAAHFEHGKYWLRRDDMARAAAAFGAAVSLMPTFSSAAANLGATLGELDRPEEALRAFTAALEHDPDNPQALNNLGVVSRELGQLAEAEAAFRRVIALTPALAFGHYNLGHTLFLQGRYHASLAAYLAGQRNDPARSPVQASRLALARLASGDAAGAVRDLKECTAHLPRDYRRQLLADTQSVAWALLSASPDLRDWRVVGDWLTAELARG